MDIYFKRLFTYLYGSLFIVLPFLMSSVTSELFEFNKMLFIYLIALSVGCLWIAKMISSKKSILEKTPLFFPICGLLVATGLSTLFSIDPHTSVYGYYGRFDGGLLSLLAYAVLYFGFVTNIGAGKSEVLKFLRLGLYAAVFVVLWGIPGRFGYDLSCGLFSGSFNNNCWTNAFRPAERMFSTLGQPNWLGAYLAIYTVISFYFVSAELFAKKVATARFAKEVAIFVLLFSGILFTRSRSSLFASVAMLTLFSLVAFMSYGMKEMKERAKYVGILLAIILGCVLVFKTGINSIDRYISLPSGSSRTQVTKPETSAEVLITESGDIRKIVWKGAWDLFKKYPLFGSGVETFGYSYYFTRPQAHNLTSEWDYLYNRAHNEYLNQLATTGAIGFLAYSSIICIFLFWYLKRRKTAGSDALFCDAVVLAWSSILITNFFGFFTTTIHVYFFLLPALLYLFLSEKNDVGPLNYDTSPSSKLKLLVPALLFLFGLVCIGTYYGADINYGKGKNYASIGDYSTASGYLQHAQDARYEHVYKDSLAFAYGNIALQLSLTEPSAKVSDAQRKTSIKNLLAEADNLERDAMAASPYNILYLRTASKLELIKFQIDHSLNHFDKAIAYLKKAESLAPTDPKLRYSRGLFYSLLVESTSQATLKKEYARKSLEAIDEALALKPNYTEAKKLGEEMRGIK